MKQKLGLIGRIGIVGLVAASTIGVAQFVTAQMAVPRPANVPVFAGTGLQAASLATNNWNIAGPLGAGPGAGAPVLTTYAQLCANQGAALLIRFNQHGLGTNQAFFFSLTPDGTNFGYNTLLAVNCSQVGDGFSLPGGATNGYCVLTNFTADMLRGAVGIRLERFTNQVAISNIIITLNQTY